MYEKLARPGTERRLFSQVTPRVALVGGWPLHKWVLSSTGFLLWIQWWTSVLENSYTPNVLMESNSTGFLPSECYNKTQYHRLCTQWMYWWNPVAQASYTVNVKAKFSTTSLRSKRICVVSDFSHGQNRQSRFSVFLCSETTRKRLLRWLQ